MLIKKTLVVALGGATGSMLRFLSVEGMRLWAGHTFPWGTLLVNVIGCFVFGLLYRLGNHFPMFTEETKALVFFGILGGFTTYSSFAHDTLHLQLEHSLSHVFANIILQLGLGFGAVWLGHALAGYCIQQQ